MKRAKLHATIVVPKQANYNYVEPTHNCAWCPEEKPERQFPFDIFDRKPRTRWEWWRDFFCGAIFGWMMVSWIMGSERKRRQVIFEQIYRR